MLFFTTNIRLFLNIFNVCPLYFYSKFQIAPRAVLAYEKKRSRLGNFELYSLRSLSNSFIVSLEKP